MASENEVKTYLAISLIRNKVLADGEIGQASGGALYLRLGAQVFKIDVDAVDQINQHPDAETEAKRFMSTLPHPYTEEDAR